MERALLVTVEFDERSRWTAEERSDELAQLASSAGAKVVHCGIVRRHEPSPGYFIGTGKAEEIAGIARDKGANVVIFNNDLTGSQQRNLEEIIHARTIDRTQLILDIFAKRARSNEGKVQVELAQLMYLLPRLTGKGVSMSRPGGGIGTSGPGEQKLEIDRRRIRDRIARLKRELVGLGEKRAMARKKRTRFAPVTVALVGYTNAGKSTLINALTGSDVVVRDKLFATLDPTVRTVEMPDNQKALIVDTVGFIKDLPHHLVEAFKATLEEVVDSDVLLHVVDASHPKAREQAEAVSAVLRQLGACDRPVITALNKIDRIGDPAVLQRLEREFRNPVPISALKRSGLEELITRIRLYLMKTVGRVKVTIPASDTKTLNLVYACGRVISTEYAGETVTIEAEVPLRVKAMLEKISTDVA